MTKIAGSESGSISQRHGSADPDLDPPQNVMDPEHFSSDFNPRNSAPFYLFILIIYFIFDPGWIRNGTLRIREKHPGSTNTAFQLIQNP